MLSGLEANTLADRLFHALAWLFVLAGTTADGAHLNLTRPAH